jgi:hypothetical protein
MRLRCDATNSDEKGQTGMGRQVQDGLQTVEISIRRRMVIAMAVLVLAASESAVTMSAQGNSAGASLSPDVVFMIPEQSPGVPFYAISGNGGFIPHDSTWAAIPFHRELSCVPGGADLLQIVGPSAFGCTLTVEGHEHWENGPWADLARQTVIYGLGAVPIIFVRWTELQPALAGGLTLPELLSLPSAIIGSAMFYKETDVLGISGPQGAGKGSYKITAQGFLSDYRTFSLHVNEVLGQLRVVQIAFGN